MQPLWLDQRRVALCERVGCNVGARCAGLGCWVSGVAKRCACVVQVLLFHQLFIKVHKAGFSVWPIACFFARVAKNYWQSVGEQGGLYA
jgi:hypothetical protein